MTACETYADCAGYHWNKQDNTYVLVSAVPADCCTGDTVKGERCYEKVRNCPAAAVAVVSDLTVAQQAQCAARVGGS